MSALEAHAEARLQQRTEELCAAAIRALAGDTSLHFRGRRLHQGARTLPLFAPHLHPKLGEEPFQAFRGAADGLALRLRLSDDALHRSLCPAEPVDRLLFDLLEQFRVESQVPDGLPGVKENLRQRFAQWLHDAHHGGFSDTARGLLLFTVIQICRTRVTGEPALEETEDMMETTRGALVPVIGHSLAGLRRTRSDQAAYAEHALALARVVGDMIRGSDDGQDQAVSLRDGQDTERAAFALVMDVDAQVEEGIAAAVGGSSRVLEESVDGYRIFTTAYDSEVTAGGLARKEQLVEFREQLDRRIAAQGLNLPRLARELKALLAEPATDGWDAGQEEGRIDGRRLAQLITSPTERRLFRTERTEPVADCIVSFLIDCSGSMRQHIESVAMLVDVFARALEMAGVSCEVLGFTTHAWNGGRAMRDWQRAGRPPHPGRLNERCHIVFKAADTPWRRARADIGVLLKGDLFREGIDGEAVDWACSRLALRDERHQRLVVVSDGCPMDGATNLANDDTYLDHHLQQVVARHDAAGRVRIHGLGVGLDLSPFYRHAQAVDLSVATGNSVFREVLELLAGRHHR